MVDLTYKQLLTAVTTLAKEAVQGAQAIHGKAQQIREEATDTGRVAEMISRMGVDPATTSETQELARLMQGVAGASVAYASAGDVTAKSARAVFDQAKATHSGIQESVNRSPIDVQDVDRDWFRQD